MPRVRAASIRAPLPGLQSRTAWTFHSSSKAHHKAMGLDSCQPQQRTIFSIAFHPVLWELRHWQEVVWIRGCLDPAAWTSLAWKSMGFHCRLDTKHLCRCPGMCFLRRTRCRSPFSIPWCGTAARGIWWPQLSARQGNFTGSPQCKQLHLHRHGLGWADHLPCGLCGAAKNRKQEPTIKLTTRQY